MKTRLVDGWTALRLTVRARVRRPGFAAVTVLTLGLGVGITTAVGSVVHTVVLAPAPYDDPHELVQVVRREGGTAALLPARDVRLLRESTGDLMQIDASRFRDVTLTDGEVPVRVRGALVTGETFPILGVEPLLGRLPTPADDVPEGPCIVLLSQRAWVDHFGADPAVVDTSARLSGEPCSVVGVMPEGIEFPGPTFAGAHL